MIHYQERLGALRTAVADANLAAVAVLPGASYYYLTGIHSFVDRLTSVLFVPRAGADWTDRPAMILPDFERFTTESAMPFDIDYFPYERHDDGYRSAFSDLASRWPLGGKCLGVEAISFRFREIMELNQTAPRIEILPADGVLMASRLHKSMEEIEAIRAAAQVTERALDEMPKYLVPGTMETELRNRFEIEVLEAGGEGLGFDSLVVSGPRAALQHAAPSERKIQRGDVVLFDVGARVRGYTADITRPFVVGEASDDVRSIYRVVLAANRAALARVRPGALAAEVDAAAREIIDQAGFGDTFIHGTGHGLGLDVHEPPRIAQGNDTVLEPGMVFTIEPGVYLHDRLGIRIEDDIVVTQDGAEALTAFDHDLCVV